MKKLLSLFLITMISSCSIVRNIEIRKQFESNFLEFDNVGMKKSPITNREYLIFLHWQIDVYGHSYPEKIISSLPLDLDSKTSPPTYQDTDYQSIISNIKDPLFQNYTLNPKYLDYPLIGLSKNQICELLKWLNDRYNEYSLISKGFQHFNPHQMNTDCFVIEAYEAGQYQGDIRKSLKDERTGGERMVRWSDGHFLPTFRLPYEPELQEISLYFDQAFKLKPYEFHKNHFLSLWNNYYLELDNKKRSFNSNFTLQLPKQYIEFLPDELKIEKGKLDRYCYQNIKYFEYSDNEETYAYPEKERTGHMKFLIISQDSLGRAITGELKKIENSDEPKTMISWVFYDTLLNIEDLK